MTERAFEMDYSVLMGQVAHRLLGEPTSKHQGGREWRYGTHGSLSIDLRKGAYYDHEAEQGGGVLDLIVRETNGDRNEAVKWLHDNGFRVTPYMRRQANEAPRHRDRDRNDATPSVNGSTGRRIVATYDYLDETGKLLFQVVRYDPKKFWQRRPDGRGGHVWDLDGVRRVLYRLPELIEAVSSGRVVFIVEGEKDADSLWAIGIPATTNPGGAGKWLPEYNEFLRGAGTVIVPDNDPQAKTQAGDPRFHPDGLPVLPGQDHAQHVARGLQGIAARVRVLDLAATWPECPPKGDIADWLDSGGTAEKLMALVDTLADWKAPGTPIDTWPVMPEPAYHGLVGDVVRTIEPHTEADPNAILIQYLVAVGNAIDRGPFYQVEGDLHFPKLFCALVGATSKGRKGTSAGRVSQVMTPADQIWADHRNQTGLASGEGLIHHVRDPVTKVNKDDIAEEVDAGVPDKRLMLQVEEFASTLAVMGRPGNTLSAVIRDAWGHKILQTMTKNSPAKSTGSHISIIAHITGQELRSALTRIEMGNGFANRFLYLKVRRSKFLPHGGDLGEEEIAVLGERTRLAIETARNIGRVTMTEDAAAAWETVYPKLSAEQPGMIGAITGRAEAQVIRIALIYALLDNRTQIETVHIKAGLAVWEFCEESARQIFGESLGDPVADTILEALRAAGPAGMSRAEISSLFGRHQTSAQIQDALNLLVKHGRSRSETPKTGRAVRPTEMWFATNRRR
jgi:hypothetical protein